MVVDVVMIVKDRVDEFDQDGIRVGLVLVFMNWVQRTGVGKGGE